MSLPTIDEPVVPRALVHVWRERCEDKAQARRAYASFLRQRTLPRVNLPAVVGWILVGMLFSMGSLYAASRAPLRLLGMGASTLESPRPQPRATGHGVSRVREPVTPVPAVVPAPSAPAASPLAHLEAKPASAAAGLAKPPVPEQWQRAARALRERDFASADAALGELTARTTGAEREAAQLARAQLLLSHGHEAEATSALKSLRLSASSSSVRRKAAELLARQQENVTSQRSSKPPEAANPP